MAKLAAVRSSGLEIRKAATVLEIALVIASAFAATYTVSLDRRGYVRTRIAHGELRADFRVLPFVSRRDAPAYTGASFVLTDRASALDSV